MAAHHETEVRHAVQYGVVLAFGIQSPRQVPIGHITDAAQAIDYPESRTLRIIEQVSFSGQSPQVSNPLLIAH